MTSQIPTMSNICQLCAPPSVDETSISRCAACLERGNIVGTVVWDIIGSAVQNANPIDRVTFMLAGLPAIFLEGIARQAPKNGNLLLAMNPSAAKYLQIEKPAIPSEESAIHWRHSTAAKVIVFAPSDTEREGIGAGLGPLARIDSQAIVDRTSAWLDILNETGAAKSYMKEMLEGLRQSQIFIDLEMWVDFILEIKRIGFAFPAHMRVQYAAPMLRIPLDGFIKLPKFKPDGKSIARWQDFNSAFQTARSYVGVYAGLMTPKQEPVDTQAVLEAVDNFDHRDEVDTLAALDAVRALLHDEPNIRPGEWRKSQRDFCQSVSWERVGSYLFAGGRQTTRKSLGEQTLVFIMGNFKDDVTQDDRELLVSLKDAIPKDPKDEEIDFFARWQERLNHPEVIRLYKSWQKRLFSKEVGGHDFLSAFSEGFEALIVAGAETLGEMNDPRILVRTTEHNKAMFWERLDAGIQKLFRFELKSVCGLFGDSVLWDLDACFEYDALNASSSNDARKVDLELHLVEASDLDNLSESTTPPKSAPRVRTTWQPGLRPKSEPISLALPDDIAALAIAAKNKTGLFRSQVFAPRLGADGSTVASITLTDRNSFSDVAQAQDGRTFDTTVQARDDVLAALRKKVSELETSYSLDSATADAMTSAIDYFGEKYKSAILAIAEDPEAGMSCESVVAQSMAFGALCRACRQHATSERARIELRPLVAKIGVITSAGTEPMAIMTAWHPFRLAERRAKIIDLAGFVKSVLHSRAARKSDLTISFDERRALTRQWVFPEVAVVDKVTMISIEDLAGYSLMVPAEIVSRSQEALENSAPSAAAKLIECVDQYLEIHPHDATNLSIAIYDSESVTLPKEIARQMVQRIHRNPDLRCDLVITHHEQGRMRSIYRNQNIRLDPEIVGDMSKGFLSRLRVDVRPNCSAAGLEEAIRDMDLVFLHDTISCHANPIWDHERGRSLDFSPEFEMTSARKPRRRLSEVDAPGIGIYLTVSRAPRAVAEYQDLLYEMGKAAVLPEGYHGVLIRYVQFDAPEVRELIQRAHDLGEWVVSYDKMCSRALLEKCGVQVIRDISVPGSSGSVIISAGKINNRLKSNVRRVLAEACGIDMETAAHLGDAVLRDVAEISGQKLLSAARFANASREMIGLCVMRAYLEAALPRERQEITRPIFISLDDYRGWFTSGKGKIADTVAITVIESKIGFELLVQVGEAKFVGMASELVETKEARHQVRDTVDRLKRIFVDNEDPISRKAWCSRLADLLVNHDGLSDCLPDPIRRAEFLENLGDGEVIFGVAGEAVICVHDHYETVPKLEIEPDQPHLRWHMVPSPFVRETLKFLADGGVPDLEGLREARWYSDKNGGQRTASRPTQSTGGNEVRPHDSSSKIGEVVATDTENNSASPAVETEGTKGEAMPIAELGSSIGTAEGSLPVCTDSEKRPHFIPGPVYTILKDMAEQEEGAINDTVSITWAEQTCVETQRALSHFGMQAHFAEPRFRLTPNGSLITFRGHETLTVDKIERRSGELLTTHGIEVVDVRPGRGKISLFVKRDKRAKVPLGSTWLGATWPDRDPGEMTNFILGAREDDDNLLYLNLAGEFSGYEEHGPHTLIAGETGSGKGILTQGLLLQLITFNAPDRAELILVDPKKGVDFTWLNGAPHMKVPVITEIDGAANIFDILVQQMDERYERLARVGTQNILQYNGKVAPKEQMRRIFLVHDEMGAWMAQEKEYQHVVMSAVANLGMKARAAGIHLTLITQRADADAVPARLRDNMGNRLCLKVQNSTGSRMVLGVRGAERLLGKGHMSCIMALPDDHGILERLRE